MTAFITITSIVAYLLIGSVAGAIDIRIGWDDKDIRGIIPALAIIFWPFFIAAMIAYGIGKLSYRMAEIESLNPRKKVS